MAKAKAKMVERINVSPGLGKVNDKWPYRVTWRSSQEMWACKESGCNSKYIAEDLIKFLYNEGSQDITLHKGKKKYRWDGNRLVKI